MRNPNRGVVLRMDDAASIHRWMELIFDGRKFDNPVIAHEIQTAAVQAKDRLGAKLIDIYRAHRSDGDE